MLVFKLKTISVISEKNSKTLLLKSVIEFDIFNAPVIFEQPIVLVNLLHPLMANEPILLIPFLIKKSLTKEQQQMELFPRYVTGFCFMNRYL